MSTYLFYILNEKHIPKIDKQKILSYFKFYRVNVYIQSSKCISFILSLRSYYELPQTSISAADVDKNRT